MLKNIKKTNMTQQVIEQFKQQILDGSWRVRTYPFGKRIGADIRCQPQHRPSSITLSVRLWVA